MTRAPSEQHNSRNALFWRGPSAEVQAARRHPGWVKFHRACGDTGLFFDDIEQIGSSRRFTATAFTARKAASDFYHLIVLANGQGLGPIAAVLAAFDGAVAGGWSVLPSVRSLLLDDRQPVSVSQIDIDAMLG